MGILVSCQGKEILHEVGIIVGSQNPPWGLIFFQARIIESIESRPEASQIDLLLPKSVKCFRPYLFTRIVQGFAYKNRQFLGHRFFQALEGLFSDILISIPE